MSETTRRIHTTLLGYFLRGLLLLVPITLMIWAIWQSLAFLDSIIKTDIPGLGLLILCGIILAAGWLGSTFLYQPHRRPGRGAAAANPIPEDPCTAP
jgi:hypothetical protein